MSYPAKRFYKPLLAALLLFFGALLLPRAGHCESILMNIDFGSSVFAKQDAQFVELDSQHFTLQVNKNLEILERNIAANPDDLALHIEMLSMMINNDLSNDFDNRNLLTYLQKIVQTVENMRDRVETAKISIAFIHATALELGVKEKEEPWKEGIRAVCEIQQETLEGIPPWPRLIYSYLCAAVPELDSTDDILKSLMEQGEEITDPQFLFALGQAYLLLLHDKVDSQLLSRDILEKSLEQSGYQPELLQKVIDKYMQASERYQEEQKDSPPWLSEILYVKMLDLDPDDAVAHNNIGFLYASLGVKLDQALFHVKKANELSSNNPYFMDSLGWVLFRRSETKEALEVLKKALEINDSIPDIYEHISSVYLSIKGGERESINALERLIELDPENLTALNNLGYMYADMDIDYEEALKLTRKAVELKPDDPYYLDSLGWAYFKLGYLDQARKYLEQSIAIDTEQPELLDHLGDVDLARGKLDKALEYCVMAAGFNPEYDHIHQKIGVIYTIRKLKRTIDELEGKQAAGETIEIDDLSNELRALSYHYRMAGLFKESLETYRKVSELHPDNESIVSRLERVKQLNSEVEKIKNLLRGTHGDVSECGALEPYIAPLPEGISVLFVLRADIMAKVLESVKSAFNLFALIDFEQAVEVLPPTTAVAVVEGNGKPSLAIISDVQETSPLKKVLTLFLSGSLNHLFPDLELKDETIDGNEVTIFGSDQEALYIFLTNDRLIASTNPGVLTTMLKHLKTADESTEVLKNATLRRMLSWTPESVSASVYLDLAQWLPRLGGNAVQLVASHFPMAEEVTNVALSYNFSEISAVPPEGEAGPVKSQLKIEEQGMFLCQDRQVPEKLAQTISTVLDHYSKTFNQEGNPIEIDHSFQVKAKYLIYTAVIDKANALSYHLSRVMQEFIPNLPALLQGTKTGESEGKEEAPLPLDPRM